VQLQLPMIANVALPSACERFSLYRTLEELSANIADCIDRYYNRERLHSALGLPVTGGIRSCDRVTPPEVSSTHTTLRFPKAARRLVESPEPACQPVDSLHSPELTKVN